MMKKSFLRDNPLACLLVPALYILATAGAVCLLANTLFAPYKALAEMLFNKTTASQPTDLFESVSVAAAQPSSLPLSSITYPSVGDRYGRLTVSGTAVDAPLYYGDANAQLGAGVGTYQGASAAGIPGEGKTVLLTGRNSTYLHDLQNVKEGATITIETHYGVYTYQVTEMKVLDYQDFSAYDFNRTDENLVLYTVYPFDNIGYTPERYFVYANYVSGPVLDADS